MEKAKLTRAQAKAIESERLLLEGDTNAMIRVHVRRRGGRSDFDKALNALSNDEYCRALYVGYEIIEEVQTAVVTQKVRNMILISYNDDSGNEATDKAYKEGVRMVLERLGITIDGIN